MLKKTVTKQELKRIDEAAESLDGWDGEDIQELDVQVDALASALSKLQTTRSGGKAKRSKEPTLADELAGLVENEITGPFAVALADEIAELIRTKDYVGYSEGYVEDRLSELVGELRGEISKIVKKLTDAAGE